MMDQDTFERVRSASRPAPTINKQTGLVRPLRLIINSDKSVLLTFEASVSPLDLRQLVVTYAKQLSEWNPTTRISTASNSLQLWLECTGNIEWVATEDIKQRLNELLKPQNWRTAHFVAHLNKDDADTIHDGSIIIDLDECDVPERVDDVCLSRMLGVNYATITPDRRYVFVNLRELDPDNVRDIIIRMAKKLQVEITGEPDIQIRPMRLPW